MYTTNNIPELLFDCNILLVVRQNIRIIGHDSPPKNEVKNELDCKWVLFCLLCVETLYIRRRSQLLRENAKFKVMVICNNYLSSSLVNSNIKLGFFFFILMNYYLIL